MTGRGGAVPATTPQGRKSASPLPSHAANQATRAPQFEGMNGMFGKAGNPPSDAAGFAFRQNRSRRQDHTIRHAFTRMSMNSPSVCRFVADRRGNQLM